MEEKKKFIINALYFGLILIIAYLVYKYVLSILAPFIIGFIIAFLSIRLCRNVFKNESKAMCIISTVILYVVIISIVVLLSVLGVNKILDLVATIPNEYKDVVEPALNNFELTLSQLNARLPIDIKTDVNEIISDTLDSIKLLVNTFSSSILSIGTSLISNTTSILINVTLVIVSSFFFVLDYEGIFAYLDTFMSPNAKQTYNEIKYFIQNNVLLIIKSYGIIMFITFIELLIGLSIIGIENSGVLSLVIALLDIFPILGVGTVLIPWGIFSLATGDIRIGISILVLYVVITFIRNIIEPKIVGGNLGLHPLVALSSMLLGLNMFGALGMFGFPLIISFFSIRRKAGLYKKNDMDKKEVIEKDL